MWTCVLVFIWAWVDTVQQKENVPFTRSYIVCMNKKRKKLSVVDLIVFLWCGKFSATNFAWAIQIQEPMSHHQMMFVRQTLSFFLSFLNPKSYFHSTDFILLMKRDIFDARSVELVDANEPNSPVWWKNQIKGNILPNIIHHKNAKIFQASPICLPTEQY